MDDVIGQAQGVSANLQQQRAVFDSIGGKMSNLGARFPVVNSLLNAIRRKKSKVGGPSSCCVSAWRAGAQPTPFVLRRMHF